MAENGKRKRPEISPSHARFLNCVVKLDNQQKQYAARTKVLSPKNYSCQFCDKPHDTQRSCYRHQVQCKKNPAVYALQCEYCRQQFRTEPAMRGHLVKCAKRKEELAEESAQILIECCYCHETHVPRGHPHRHYNVCRARIRFLTAEKRKRGVSTTSIHEFICFYCFERFKAAGDIHNNNNTVRSGTRNNHYEVCYKRKEIPAAIRHPGEDTDTDINRVLCEVLLQDEISNGAIDMVISDLVLRAEFPSAINVLISVGPDNLLAGNSYVFPVLERNHWVCALYKPSQGGNPPTFDVYDSLFQSRRPNRQLHETAMRRRMEVARNVQFTWHSTVPRQADLKACGAFTLAVLTAILHGLDPTAQLLQLADINDQAEPLREHIAKMLVGQTFEPFPLAQLNGASV